MRSDQLRSKTIWSQPTISPPTSKHLVRWNSHGYLIRVRAFDVARIHRGDDVVVDLTSGDGAVRIRSAGCRGRIQSRVGTAGLRASINVIAHNGRLASVPIQRDGVGRRRRFGRTTSGERDGKLRIRRVARDREAPGTVACGLGIEIHANGQRLARIKSGSRPGAVERESRAAHGDIRNLGVRIARILDGRLQCVGRSDIYISKTQ
jgi:hypothetical protein